MLMQLATLENKVRVAFLETFTSILEGEELDYSKLSYDDLVAIILSADVATLEEVSEDILENEKLSYDEKMKLWQLIDERLNKEVGL